MPSIVAGICSEDMWISALINLSFDFITLLFVVHACKKADVTFIELLNRTFGKIGAKIILSLYFIYFMAKAVLPLNEQKDYVEQTLYTLMPTVFYFLPFFLAAFYLCVKKLRVLGRSADVLWLCTVLGFLILFFLSVTNADFAAILPVGAQGGKKIIDGAYSSLNWFGDSVYVMFFIGEFAVKKHDGIKIFLSYAVSAVIIIAFTVIFYSIFTSIAYRQKFALTEISKYTTEINNMGRFDYIGILLLLLSNVFAISMPIYFSVKTLNHLCEFKKNWISPLIVVAVHVFIMLYFTERFYSIENFIINHLGIFFFLFGNVLPIFTVFLTKNKKELTYENKQS